LILLDNEPVAVPKFISAQKLLEDKFIIEFSNNNKNKTNKIKKIGIELNLGDIACFVKPHSDFVCDTIVRGILPKRHNGLESPTVYVLVTDNKFDFYTITEIADKKYKILDRALKNIIVKRIFTIHQLAHFLIIDLEKDLKKYKSKLVVITGDFFLSDPQITKQDKDWLYPQMSKAIQKVKDSIILVFSPTKLSELVNYG
jgi:lipid II:glycine glycyltransferase (peptidoglycan interpeptide bridge formation enzyme)